MPPVRIARDGPVLRVTLARPEKRNAFNEAMVTALSAAFTDVGDSRAVVLSGEGPSFCAGADAEWLRASTELTEEENVADALRMRRMLQAIDSCPAPVVCAVQGHALGGGVGLVACSDVAISATETVFGLTETRLGIVPGAISPFVLERIGPGAARRYFLTGERFGAETALRIGLVHEIAPELDSACERVVADLLAGGPEAVRAAKRLVLDAPLGDETARRIAERRVSAEGQEGLLAFLEGRAPAWRSGSSS